MLDNICCSRAYNKCFHMQSLQKLLGISWMSRTPNTVFLSRCGLMLFQRRLRWLGHVRRMNDGRIPKDLLHRELTAGKRNLGRPQLPTEMCANKI